MFDICTDVHIDSHMFLRLSVRMDTKSALTKPATTAANVDSYCMNLVICLQLDTTLLFQNSVQI